MSPFESALRDNPTLGYVYSAGSLIIGVITSTYGTFIEHIDLATKLAAMGAAFFGLCAGYYTLRIQRRNFKSQKP
jgi:ABC-type branched-subunit amino acid transport system permease subunit